MKISLKLCKDEASGVEDSRFPFMRKPVPETGWRKPLAAFSRGLMFVLKPLQVVSNFVFLLLTYVLGVGLSAFFYRLGPGRKKNMSSDSSTYWRELPPASQDKDAWLLPF